jgi:hypothetical protein
MFWVHDARISHANNPDHEKAHPARRNGDPSRRSRNARTTKVTVSRPGNGLIRGGPFSRPSNLIMDEAAPGACGPPGPGRHDYGSDGLGPAQAVLAAGHRGGDGVSLVLVGPGGHAIQAEGGQCLPAPGRAGQRASLSVPASPRGGREDLDDLGPAGGERREQIEPCPSGAQVRGLSTATTFGWCSRTRPATWSQLRWSRRSRTR